MAPDDAPLRPFFTYFGGKYRSAPRYPKPRHTTIVEPFAGSAGYSLRHSERAVILVERDEKVAATWRYLLSAMPEDVRALPLIGEGWQTTDDLADHFDPGAVNLIGFWLSKATTAPRKCPSAWAIARPDVVYWGTKVRERIASQVDRIRHWRLIEGDYSMAPDLEATWFIDPPYSSAGHRYRYGSRFIDYPVLADWCQARTGQVLVCEGDDATWLPFGPFARVNVQRGYFREALWTQGDVA